MEDSFKLNIKFTNNKETALFKDIRAILEGKEVSRSQVENNPKKGLKTVSKSCH